MKMKKILFLLMLSVFVFGCSSIVRKPDIYSVKKLAIISVYANNDIYNIETGKSKSKALDYKALKALVGKEDSFETNEIAQIATAGLDSYLTELKRISQWAVVDPKSILNNPTYKTFSSPYLPPVKFQATSALNMRIFSFQDAVSQEARKALAQLCKALNLDAVAIIELDLGYKTVFLSGMRGTGLFSGVKAPAEPSVSSAMIIVTKDGTVGVRTHGIQRGGGTRFKGARVTMLHQGVVTLKADEAVREYAKVVKMSAEDLKTRIEKELAAK